MNGYQVHAATGEGAQQTMNVGTTLKVFTEAIQGLFELTLKAAPDPEEFARIRDAAAADVQLKEPTGAAVRTFADRAAGIARLGGNTAFAAAMGLATNDLVTQMALLIARV